ncbi:MAG: hypothetical protein ACRDHW_04425 [Ktedonobacteraceae bacterium]
MSIGTPSEGFECTIYLPRCQPEREWILEVCHTLWRHGIAFVRPDLLGTWEEQLQVYSSTQKSLSDQINEIVAVGDGELDCYDCRVPFELSFDSDLRNAAFFGTNLDWSAEQQAVCERSSLGKLTLSISHPTIEIEHRLSPLPVGQAPSAAYLVPPYQQIHLAVLHWLEMLCTQLQPAFAVGYYSTNSFLAPEENFLYQFDLAMIAALEQSQFPPLRDWLTSVYTLYVPAPLMTSPQAEEWLTSPGMWRRQLSNQAWLAYCMPETFDEVRVEEFNKAAASILDWATRDRTQFPLARIYLQRAQEILAITQRHNTITKLQFDQLTYMEEHPEMFS